MDTEINTQEAIPGGGDVSPADGVRNDESVVNQPTLRDVLGQTLKREFKTDEDALAAVKNTFSYVGEYPKFKPFVEKMKATFGGDGTKGLKFMEEAIQNSTQKTETTAPVAPQGDYISRSQYEADKFFASRPDLTAHREVLEALQAKSGKALAETAEMPSFKTLVEKAKLHDESEGSKSVLHTNPRIGAATDKITKARDAVKAGDHDTAKATAVSAVLDSIG